MLLQSRTCDSTAPFKCDIGRCLKRDAICNGIIDCTDGKDEHDDNCQVHFIYFMIIFIVEC